MWSKRCLAMVSASVIYLILLSPAQLTVDATVPIRQRHREPVSGSAGSFARKIPILVRLETNGSPPDENGKTLMTVILTNSGKDNLEVPSSPHPGDFEPEDSRLKYTTRMLSVYLTLDQGDAANRRRTILPGNTFLYGRSSAPGTLMSLAPGESIRVLARFGLPTDLEVKESGVIVGRVCLNDQTIKTQSGQTTSDTQEIGCANSQDYILHALLISHE